VRSAARALGLAGALGAAALLVAGGACGAHAEASDPAASAAARFDWDAARREAATLLGELVRIDTTVPPGREAAAATHLGRWLARRGLEVHVVPFGPERANVVARLPATAPPPGAAPEPLLLLAHLDVVPADPSAWSFPPFAGDVGGGAVRGRGTLDDKGHAAIFAEALALLAASGLPRARDLVLAATGGEEVDGAGVRDLIANHWELLGPPVAVWNEGGAAAPVDLLDGRMVSGIAVSEKRALWLELVAEGSGGHGSQPTPDGSVERLSRAVSRVAAWETPLRLTDTVGEQFRRLAEAAPFPRSVALRHAGNPLVLSVLGPMLARDRLANAMVRDTVAVTGLHAGLRHNVIPREARAWLDVRLLPDTDVDAFVASLRRVIDDPDVRIEGVEPLPAPPASPVDHPLFEAIGAAMDEELPGSLTVPLQTTGGTDSSWFRMRGVPAYGFQPLVLSPALNASIHGPDERLPLVELERAVRVTTRVLVALTRPEGGGSPR
jgi:acetylornithine deacetylase/succinyl-diaminopimelate desuccinylase-like protein